MKRIIEENVSSGFREKLFLDKLSVFRMPRIPFSKKWFLRIVIFVTGFLLILLIVSYFLVVRPVLSIARAAKELKGSTFHIQKGVQDLNFDEIKTGLDETKSGLDDFRVVYEKNMGIIRKLPGTEVYYQDSQRLMQAAEQSIQLGDLVVGILEPYAADLGFATKGTKAVNIPAEDRVIKLLRLTPEFAPKVSEISDRVVKIDSELSQIDASRYPTSLPKYVEKFGIDSDINLQEQILSVQSISRELADKAPQFEALFNAIPEFMGLNEPKRYLILMANNYEIRSAGGFNTYITVVEFKEGIPEILDSIDTYFIDEGDRTGSSHLVNRNVPYHLRNYLYIQDRGGRLYARDATSVSPDFPVAADTLYNGFWRKDWSLPQNIDGIIQVNNDVAVDILKVVGPVNTEKFSVLTDQRTYITIPITEFNSENVVLELENIAGGRLAETIDRKNIIKYLAQSLLTKIFTSEATNLVSIVRVGLDSLSKKDVILYSFDPDVQAAFEGLGYGGRIKAPTDPTWDYLHVNRSNFGAGKADWTKEGFVTQEVVKTVEEKNGKKISTVEVTVHNPKRPEWYNIDPCCFYNAYFRVYVPQGSKMISVTASDGQDPKGAEYFDDDIGLPYLESFTRQLKETNLTITFVYELPESIDLQSYNLLVQRQPGVTSDPYTVKVNGNIKKFLINADKVISF